MAQSRRTKQMNAICAKMKLMDSKDLETVLAFVSGILAAKTQEDSK